MKLLSMNSDSKNNINSSSGKGAEDVHLGISGDAADPGTDKSHVTHDGNSASIRNPSTKPISTDVNVVVNIHRGPATPAQKQSWNRFWQKMIMEVKKEAKE